MSARETRAGGADRAALLHDPDIPALQEIRLLGIEDVLAEAGLGPVTAVRPRSRGSPSSAATKPAGRSAPLP
jgi:hypothetical protein